LQVSQAEVNSSVLQLSYKAPVPEDCATVLNAVLESYQEYLNKTHRSVSQEAIVLISEAKDSLLKQLTEKEQAYRKFRQEAPLLWDGDEGRNVHQIRLKEIETARAELMIEQTTTQAEIDAIGKALARGDSRQALLLVLERSVGRTDAGAQSFTGQLFPLMLEEQKLLETHGPEHPKVKAARSRIEFAKNFIKSAALEQGLDENKPVDFLSMYLDSLRHQMKTSEQKQQQLTELFASERESAKSLSSYEMANENYKNEIARTQKLFDGVVKALEEMSLMKGYGGTQAQVIQPATFGWQVEPNFTRIMIVAGLLGLAAGLALAYMLELADKSFRNPEEITEELGVPVIGHIPVLKPDRRRVAVATSLDPSLCTFHHPRSAHAEAYRAVRTALYFSTRGERHKVIQVSSAEPGDGKSTLAANLAISIAQSGKRVLLIDADFRRPKVHKLFGLERRGGLPRVIDGKAELDDEIQTTEVANLWALTCGTRPDNPSELLTSPRFEELLEMVREKFEFVIVDTPPLLAVTDPSAVAARADGVLLALRLTPKARSHAHRTTDLLESLGANILGIVVNAVGDKHGRYGKHGYNSYRYGGYVQQYVYGQNGSGAYYSDEEPDEIPVGPVSSRR
jgi:capsular exopolysaccharide synthesis family protein